ncbi:hypothetical protein JVT61DRAFT_9618 [Boletus reticuloceps]|uniref:Uncharacterized protein n=1 Tax=Boletus reticuloceps TaxID=495285 RepID=A0A8I2YG88_9AGAM|nr:hypothetical protein JVT61DRAFT_9618 [Boletus reticuloceps]
MHISCVTADILQPSLDFLQHPPSSPLPISLMTQHTPVTLPVAPHASQAIIYSQHHQCAAAPMNGFVQEVIRCCQTSGSVLQTALCYLEASAPDSGWRSGTLLVSIISHMPQ